MNRFDRTALVLVGTIALLSTGCSVTVGSTDGTTDSFQNTTEASGDISEGSIKFTSSTSPRGDDDADDVTKAKSVDEARKKAAQEFAAKNYDELRSDVAHGHGEYLAAVADILHVTPENQPKYFAESKVMFLSLTAKNGGSPEHLAERLFELSKTVQS